MRKLFLIFTVLSLLFFSCHKDRDDESSISETNTEQPTINNAKEGVLYGVVVDEAGKGMPNVSIRSFGKVAQTDQNGSFILRKALISPTGTYVTAEANGYFLGSDMVFSAGKDAYAKIRMLKKDKPKKIVSSDGGQVEIDGGGNINFPANAFMSSSGQSYQGEVTIYAKRIATDNKYFAEVMPGGLIAEDEKGRTVVLGSAGMIAVEMYGENNQELQLQTGITARTSFPIAQHQQSTVDQTIKLWSFNESTGLWKEEGVATKEGNHFVGELPHFSFWNVDAPFPLIKLSGRIIRESDNLPVPFYQVYIQSDNYGVAYGWTDSEGRFCGLVPKNEPLVVSNLNLECQGFSEGFGPFDTDTDIGDIIIEENELIINVTCNGAPAPDTYVLVTEEESPGVEGNTTMYWAANGTLDLNISCLNEILTISAFDPDTGLSSGDITIDPDSEGESVELVICDEDCDLSMELITNGDEICEITDYVLTAEVSGGSGDYSYLWSNGETTQSINFNFANGSVICVDVMDNNMNCAQEFCFDIEEEIPYLGVEYGVEGTCESDASIILMVSGEAPYNATISSLGINVDFNDYTVEIENIPFGEYEVTVTDSRGCTNTVIVEVNEFNSGFFAEVYQSPNCETGENYISIGAFGQEFLPITAEIIETGLIETFDMDPAFLGPVDPGIYTVKVTSQEGCEFIAENVIIEESFIFGITAPMGTVFCDEPIPLGVSPYSPNYVAGLEWSNGQTTPNIFVESPGEYCVTVYTLDECTYDICITVTSGLEGVEFSLECGGDGLYFISSDPLVQLFPSYISNQEIINNINIENGYAYFDANGNGCALGTSIQVYSNEAVGNFEVNNTTCEDCDDGYITFVNNSSSVFCERCMFTDTAIFDLSDIGTDLSDENAQQSLPQGNYVLVGYDSEGCITMRLAFVIN